MASINFFSKIRDKGDGASRLLDLLVNHSTHLHFLVGRAVNPAHQNPNFPRDLTIKLKVVKELIDLLKQTGKKVSVEFY